jgi:hypothetical protein
VRIGGHDSRAKLTAMEEQLDTLAMARATDGAGQPA